MGLILEIPEKRDNKFYLRLNLELPFSFKGTSGTGIFSTCIVQEDLLLHGYKTNSISSYGWFTELTKEEIQKLIDNKLFENSFVEKLAKE